MSQPQVPQPRPHVPGVGMFVFGAILLAVGGIAWYVTRSDAALCSSAFVSALAPSQCDRAVAIHDVATIGFLGGLALLVIAFIRDYRS